MKKFLFCIVGVGAGNTTRNLAIIEELRAMGDCEVRLAAQGNALKLLRDRFRTYPLETVEYTSGGDFNAADILRSNLNFPARFVGNMREIARILREYQPDLVVADSDFYCLRPARKLGFGLVSINNSPWVVEGIRRMGGVPRDCRFSYQFIEKTDYWLQRRYPQRVLCPVLRALKGLPGKYHQVPPFVRPEIQASTSPGDEVVVLTGGSGIGTADIDLRALKGQKITVLGAQLEKVPDGTNQPGFTLDVTEHLRRAKVLVVQGGFSSVSEAVALRIPTVVVPISRHAEQWSNARHIEELGLGLMCREGAKTGATVKRILDDYPRYWEQAQALRVPTDGHKKAAELLWRWVNLL
ncbi:hypothetical protein KQI84_14480 [bacterium]|nr:hypothetical protein [bacterium]